VLGDDGGPQWLASLEDLVDADRRHARLAAYGAAAHLSHRLTFVVAPVLTRRGEVAVGLAPGLLLSVSPFLEGAAVDLTAAAGDSARSVLANMMGDLHRQPQPPGLPVWRPTIGRPGHPDREALERCLAGGAWDGGPWSVPTCRLITEARTALVAALRRFSLLAAAVGGHVDGWVVTHGRADGDHLIRTPDGHRLVGWGAAARAPRERDLAAPLDDAEGNEPWYAYLESGGVPEPLSQDTVELFALERHLSRVARAASRLSRPHPDTADERRCFEGLEQELAQVLARWH